MSSARYCKLDPATRTIQPDEHSPSEDTILDGPNQAVPPGPQDVDKAMVLGSLLGHRIAYAPFWAVVGPVSTVTVIVLAGTQPLPSVPRLRA